jgi:hypothetical protein
MDHILTENGKDVLEWLDAQDNFYEPIGNEPFMAAFQAKILEVYELPKSMVISVLDMAQTLLMNFGERTGYRQTLTLFDEIYIKVIHPLHVITVKQARTIKELQKELKDGKATD